jgi:hypothetical protein
MKKGIGVFTRGLIDRPEVGFSGSTLLINADKFLQRTTNAPLIKNKMDATPKAAKAANGRPQKRKQTN